MTEQPQPMKPFRFVTKAGFACILGGLLGMIPGNNALASTMLVIGFLLIGYSVLAYMLTDHPRNVREHDLAQAEKLGMDEKEAAMFHEMKKLNRTTNWNTYMNKGK